ncbi:nicotinate-nucleotide--dimethylbenzimidazole phosphoribosyltransferase [Streptomyces sp. NPDC051784]|uniref:nicotinate-nucleotide--dimethylbenzimidazole phosphoribosyltransferase n=1 Tax=Streptomyces sp. NPDC051784 TaxID=3155805 RepID=UPI00342620D5
MTDTGQIPGEGLPENAGMVEQPGIPAQDAYTYLEPSEHTAEDDDLLLMPAAQGAWSDAAAAPPEQYPGQEPTANATYGAGVAEVNGVRIPAHTPVQVPAAAAPARRPLHRGPASTEAPSYGGPQTGGVVRSLADRGPAGPQHSVPVRHAGPPTTGPEYFDFPVDEAPLPGPQLGEIPPQTATAWAPQEPVAQPEPEPAHAPETTSAAAEPAPSVEHFVPEPHPVPEESVTPTEAAVAPDTDAVPEAAVAPVAEHAEELSAQALSEPHVFETPVAPAESAAPVEAQVMGEPEVSHAADPYPAEPSVAVSAPEPVVAPESPAAFPPAPQPTEPEQQAQEEQVPSGQVAQHPDQVAVDQVPVAAQTAFPGETAVPEQTAVPEPQPAAEAAPDEPAVAEFAPVGPAVAEFSGPLVAEQPEAPAETPAPAEPETVEPRTVESETVEPVPAPQAVVPPQAGPEVPAALHGPAGQVPEHGPRTLADRTPEHGTGPEIIETPDAGLPADAPVEDQAPQAEAVQEAVEPRAPHEPVESPDAAGTQVPATDAPGRPEPVDVPDAAETPDPGPEVVPAAATDPASAPAPGYDDAEREAVLRVMRERRDIRNGFRSDPIPHEVLLRVLEAAHTAPSVGHSQPWDFVVIRSAETRRSMHELAQRQRDAYAKSLPKARAKQFKELKIEAILDTPVNIVVTADPTRGGRHTLGRHTQPQMAPYSSALAVENLWLAARAEGLGVGWVSFFDEREMVRALGLPDHLEVVAYLCVGYVDEFPDEPELMQAGWSKRRPLSWVVHEETYGRRALPGEEPHDLLQETIAGIRPLDAKALGEAWERQKRMTKPAGALGMLEIISAQLSGLSRLCPPPVPEPAAVAIFAGDHGVHAQGVTAWPQEVTGQMVANFLGGGAVCNAFAAQVGAEVCVVDVGVAAELPATPGLLPRKVRPGTADFTTGPALTREEVLAAIEVGIETARDLVAAGNKGLLTGEMGIANTTASAALICVYTGMDPAEVTGRGTGINDEMHARKVDVVRRALELHQPDPADPIGVLAAVGGLEHAAMAGFLLGGASLRTPVILDGVSAGAAALVARAIAPEALAACIAGHRSAEPGHVAALNKLGLRPLVDLDLRLGEGTGALLALPIVQSAARAMHDVATFDSAGVTEK